MRNVPLAGKMSINNRLAVVIGSVIFVAGVLTILFVNSKMKAHALYEAKNKAGVILDSRLSVHTYFSHQLKPALFDILSKNAPELNEKFEPVWMSSTYAVREMEKYFKSLHTTPHYYKEAAINARHPENEADAFEREFIERLNQDANLHVFTGIRTFDKTPYFTILQRGETMEETCLRCHTEPNLAPHGLVDAYGPQRSFDRTLGEVVSAVSIRIPLDEAYASANQLSSRLAFAFGVVLLGIYLIIVFLNKRWVFTPLAFIREKARRIATDPKELGEQIKTPKGWELANLTNSFNSMSSQLYKERNELEDRVRKRTAELEEANNNLGREMAERQKAEERLIQANQLLQDANAQKDRLFYIIAHDLRSPMSGLLTGIEMLANDPELLSVEKGRTLLELMFNNAKNTFALLEDLLQWARMSQGGIDYAPAPCDLNELVGLSISTTQDEAERKDIGIRLDIPQEMIVLIDQPMIKTVFRNILFNAVKFTPRGGEIVITARQQDTSVILTVRDNGIGMDGQILATIFSIENNKRQLGTEGERGTGLGLVLCKQFIEQHGGEIWVESEQGKGTTVFFTIPAEEPA